MLTKRESINFTLNIDEAAKKLNQTIELVTVLIRSLDLIVPKNKVDSSGV